MRVLVVDDNPADQYLLQRLLAQDDSCRYELVHTADGDQATELLGRNRFDCVMLDYHLPKLSGLEILGRLKSSASTVHVPVIMMTRKGTEEVAVQCMRRGAADYLRKGTLTSATCRRAVNDAIEKAALRRTIEEQNRRLEQTNETLRERNDAISNFYHCVSHEIKTPLTAIREFVSIVKDGIVGEITDKQRETLSYAVACCDDLAFMFNDLVDSTRLETGKLTLHRRHADLNRAIERSILAARPAAEVKGIQVDRRLNAALPELYIDEARITQVVSNLLSNAVRFTDPEGQITAFSGWSSSGAEVEFGVADTGRGIDDSQLDRVFDRLYQGNPVREEQGGGGLGLGLSIAKEIVDLHGGSIEVESEFGIGSTFYVRLPIAGTTSTQTKEFAP